MGVNEFDFAMYLILSASLLLSCIIAVVECFESTKEGERNLEDEDYGV